MLIGVAVVLRMADPSSLSAGRANGGAVPTDPGGEEVLGVNVKSPAFVLPKRLRPRVRASTVPKQLIPRIIWQTWSTSTMDGAFRTSA